MCTCLSIFLQSTLFPSSTRLACLFSPPPPCSICSFSSRQSNSLQPHRLAGVRHTHRATCFNVLEILYKCMWRCGRLPNDGEKLRHVDAYLMMVRNCDMVSSCGTKNFVLSRTGRFISLVYRSTITCKNILIPDINRSIQCSLRQLTI